MRPEAEKEAVDKGSDDNKKGMTWWKRRGNTELVWKGDLRAGMGLETSEWCVTAEL